MYHLQGVCKYSDSACAYAHSTEELRTRPSRKKVSKKKDAQDEQAQDAPSRKDMLQPTEAHDAPSRKDMLQPTEDSGSSMQPPPGLITRRAAGQKDVDSSGSHSKGMPQGPPHGPRSLVSSSWRPHAGAPPQSSAAANPLANSWISSGSMTQLPAVSEPMKVQPIVRDPPMAIGFSPLAAGPGAATSAQNPTLDKLAGLCAQGGDHGISSEDLFELSQSLAKLNNAISRVASAGRATSLPQSPYPSMPGYPELGLRDMDLSYFAGAHAAMAAATSTERGQSQMPYFPRMGTNGEGAIGADKYVPAQKPGALLPQAMGA